MHRFTPDRGNIAGTQFQGMESWSVLDVFKIPSGSSASSTTFESFKNSNVSLHYFATQIFVISDLSYFNSSKLSAK